MPSKRRRKKRRKHNNVREGVHDIALWTAEMLDPHMYHSIRLRRRASVPTGRTYTYAGSEYPLFHAVTKCEEIDNAVYERLRDSPPWPIGHIYNLAHMEDFNEFFEVPDDVEHTMEDRDS